MNMIELATGQTHQGCGEQDACSTAASPGWSVPPSSHSCWRCASQGSKGRRLQATHREKPTGMPQPRLDNSCTLCTQCRLDKICLCTALHEANKVRLQSASRQQQSTAVTAVFAHQCIWLWSWVAVSSCVHMRAPQNPPVCACQMQNCSPDAKLQHRW
jgi:hypothetical protein